MSVMVTFEIIETSPETLVASQSLSEGQCKFLQCLISLASSNFRILSVKLSKVMRIIYIRAVVFLFKGLQLHCREPHEPCCIQRAPRNILGVLGPRKLLLIGMSHRLVKSQSPSNFTKMAISQAFLHRFGYKLLCNQGLTWLCMGWLMPICFLLGPRMPKILLMRLECT